MIDSKLFLDKNKTILLGTFENPDQFLETVGMVHKKGIHIIDCYTPFPIHGIDRAMGLKRSLLPIGAFVCGCIGFTLAFIMQTYMTSLDWPMIIGNKPTIGVSYVPVLFESTILCTAFGLAILFFIRNKMLHGKMPSERIDFRQTDDRMIIAISTDNGGDKNEISSMLYKGGAVAVKERLVHGYEDFTETEINKAN